MLTSIAGRNHGESDAGQKPGGPLFGDDQRETFLPPIAPLKTVKINTTVDMSSQRLFVFYAAITKRGWMRGAWRGDGGAPNSLNGTPAA